jgi:hypothetical protein
MIPLTWTIDHGWCTRIKWFSRILPHQKFAEICRKVYFAVEDYSEIDLIIANGYLSYMFFEQVVISGHEDYRRYSQLCQTNFQNALSRLPLLLPTYMETVAALNLGVRMYWTRKWQIKILSSCLQISTRRLRIYRGHAESHRSLEGLTEECS